jgi:acetyl esterase/lipase
MIAMLLVAQGTILDMIEDVSTAMNWVTNEIHSYGGNAQDMVVVGQSAGAQLAALAVLFQAGPALHDVKLHRISTPAASLLSG